MSSQQGDRTPEMRRDRHTLSLSTWQPRKNAQLGGVEQSSDTHEIDEVQRFGEAIWSARNIWSINRHRNGLLVAGRLSRPDAEAALRQELTALEEEDR